MTRGPAPVRADGAHAPRGPQSTGRRDETDAKAGTALNTAANQPDDGRVGDDRPSGPHRPSARRAPGGGGGDGDRSRKGRPTRYAAIDLGTNNCRLLIAAPSGRGYRIVDAFSRIVRLGEGLSQTGALGEAAIERTIEALKICAEKIERRGVNRLRCIATQACRAASNGEAFLERVRADTGLEFEIITTEEEARLAARGCADLIDVEADAAVVFDIGGGSTEISFVRPPTRPGRRARLEAWFSMPVGVVNLSERWGGRNLSRDDYARVVDEAAERIAAFGDPADLKTTFTDGRGHLLGTSGTVTSIAGVHLGLERYRRDAVDGLWLSAAEAREVSHRLLAMSWEERAKEACIGAERADLVVCGCAILEALLRVWPAQRLRVADRGLREGVLAGLAEAEARRRRKPRRGSGGQKRANRGPATPEASPR